MWRTLAGLAILMLSVACGRSPTAAGSVEAVDLSGFWNGQFREIGCTSVCEPCCSARYKGGFPMRDFTLSLVQQGSELTGRFEELARKNVNPLKGTVSGSVSARQVKLAGSLAWRSELIPDSFGFVDLRDFDGTVDPALAHLTAKFVLLDRGTGTDVWMRLDCEVVRMERGSP